MASLAAGLGCASMCCAAWCRSCPHYLPQPLHTKEPFLHNVSSYHAHTFGSDFVNYDGTDGTINYTYYMLENTANTIDLVQGDPNSYKKLSEVDFNNKANYETGQYSQTTGLKETNANRIRYKELIKVSPGTITAKLICPPLSEIYPLSPSLEKAKSQISDFLE